jgi:hypothetical protein
MANEKRNTHSYKCTDVVYKAAMKRSKKDKIKLASMIEEIVISYASGALSAEIREK